MFHASELTTALRGLRFGEPVYFHPQIGSTNDEAKRLADEGAAEGTLVIAEEQTAGRGRAGRRWLTPPGTALALSLLLRPRLAAAQSARLTMLAGLAVCQAIEQATPLHADLKWPNDVLIHGYKAGGILVETTLQGQQLDYAVVGLGLNVNWSPAPTEVDFPATSLSAEAGQTLDRLELLRAILARMEVLYPDLTHPALYHDWRARLLWLGEPIAVHTAEGELRGQAQSVDNDGALVLLLDTGETRRVMAGDVRLRRGE